MQRKRATASDGTDFAAGLAPETTTPFTEDRNTVESPVAPHPAPTPEPEPALAHSQPRSPMTRDEHDDDPPGSEILVDSFWKFG